MRRLGDRLGNHTASGLQLAKATTLLLAYQMAASLSAVINAQRLCLGSLPGYEELCKRRMLLQPANQQKVGKTPRPISNKPLKPETGWMSVEWQPSVSLSNPMLAAHLRC